MAKNFIYPPTRTFPIGDPTIPTNVTSGAAVALGNITGVALTDDDAEGNVAGGVVIGKGGVAALSVEGEDQNGNSAVAAGDILYVDTDGVINKDATGGKRLGIAWGTAVSHTTGWTAVPADSGDTLVASGQTATIAVLLDA